jgi:tetratricopeptide (TPR) repeat protein
MRKLNGRFLLGLIVTIAVVTVGLIAIHVFQYDRIAGALLWQAEKAREAQQHDQAAVFYERYLEFRPDDSRVMLALADMLENDMNRKPVAQRQPRKVVYLLEKVLEIQPELGEVRRRVVQLYLLPRMRRYKDAEAHLDILQREFPEDGQLWQWRAICQEQLGQYQAAVESLEHAIRFPPEQVHSYELLARLLRKRLHRIAQADDMIERMVREHSDNYEAHLARARYKLEFHLGDFSSDAEKAFQLAPDNAEAILLYARSLQMAGQSAGAIARLEEGIRKHPTDARMYRHLAWIEYFAKRSESARKWLQAGIVACPEAHELHTALAEILIQSKMFDQVQSILDELKFRGVREDHLKYLSARIAVEQGQWTRAVEQLERLRTEARTNAELAVQVNILLAHCFKQLGDSDRQAEALRRVLELDTQSLPARLGLAQLYATSGRLDEAIKEYHQLLQLPQVPDSVPLEMARLMIRRKERNRADTTPWSEIEKLIASVEQRKTSYHLDAILVRADLLLARQRKDEAKALLAQHVPQTNEPRAWVQYAYCAEVADGTGPDILDQAVRRLGDLPEFRLQRASILLSRSPLKARTLLKDLAQIPTEWTAEQKHQLLQGLAELHFVVQDYATGRRLLQELAAERPNDLQCRLLLAETLLQDGLLDALLPLLHEIQLLEPKGGTLSAFLEVRRALSLAEQGDTSGLQQAKSKLETLTQQRPNSPLLHQCLGRWAEAEGNKSLAVRHYRQAIELGDTDLDTPHRLIRLLMEMKQPAEAEAVVSRIQQRAFLPIDKQRSILARVAPLLRSAAVQQFVTRSVDKENEDPKELIWLGKMLWDTGDRSAALESFQAALQKGRHLPEAWITLVEAFGADGKMAEARQLLDQARSELPPDLARRVRATGYEILQIPEQALQEYRAMIDSGPIDPYLLRRGIRLFIMSGRTLEAITYLEKILEKPNNLSKADVGWVRRNLAVLGISERTSEQFARGLELLRQNEAELGPNVEDMRAKVVLLSQQSNVGSEPKPRQQAIALLEEIVRRGEASREDRFALAKLYDTERNWPKAEAYYRSVIAADARNPMPLAYLARRLLQQDKVPEAAECVRQLEALVPNSPMAVSLRSRVFYQSGQLDLLVPHFSTYVREANKPEEMMRRSFLAGSLLDEFVRTGTRLPANERFRLREAALQFYEKSIQAHPEAVARMVALWSHTGQRETALRWLRDPRMKIPIHLRASAEIASLRDAHADEAEMRRVEDWLRQTAQKHPEVAFDLHFAELAELRHDFATAEKHYRKVLESQPGHVVALNNLAWVLAHQGPSTEALQLIQRAILAVGPIADLLDTRARVYLALGRAVEAIQDLEDATAEAPTAMRYFQLALAHDRAGNAAAARDALRSALELGFDERDLHPVDLPDLERLKRSY